MVVCRADQEATWSLTSLYFAYLLSVDIGNLRDSILSVYLKTNHKFFWDRRLPHQTYLHARY